MGFRAVRSWTLSGLVVAFFDLAVAYTLLCGSAFAFVPSKLLSFFGLYMPCPCRGLFGYQNNDLCLHRLLIDLPIRKINTVKELAKNRFPYDFILFEHKSCNLHVEGIGNRKYGNGVIELEGEECSSALSGPKSQGSVDRESGYDAKGKKIMNQKHKSGIRRRRRAALGYGKLSAALSSNGTRSVSLGVPFALYDDGSGMRSEIGESLDLGSGIEDRFLGDQIVASLKLDGSHEKGKDISRDQLRVEKFNFDVEGSACDVGNVANVILVLEQALEEEKAARAVLYQELEKERAAAATAADEAMAMILRLQKDKASIEMEARQYHRVIEEKFAYDEEEMKILKEILVRREKEIHFLEKEIEAYEQMQMNFSGIDQVEDDSSYKINSKEQRRSPSIDSNETPLLMPQWIEKSKSIAEKEVAISAKWPSNYENSHTFILGKEIMSKHKELPSDFSSQGMEQKTVSIPGKEKTERDISMILPDSVLTIGEEVEKDGEHWNQEDCNMHSPMVETESTVYDVHVIDDKTVLCKENDGKESRPLSSTTSYRVQTGKFLTDSPTISMEEIEPIVHESSFDMQGKLLMSGSSVCKTFNIDSRRHSPSPVDDERLKIDNEVEWLRERLRIVQEEKEMLTFSAEHREKVNVQLKLVEDILKQLQEIQQLREPKRQASLPSSSSKVNLKKRHNRSASGENFASD
ncbi:hypothetical protein JCGZ_17541 [Jatropha curcas]|uniref:GTD-binding domain-containing protein n=1 Tax=Jatropha curcas TaxID=180498 RepID=A0A067JUA6_JATCU|nr:hypothetical protein JCGZ_17541 [Jatropha curcas]